MAQQNIWGMDAWVSHDDVPPQLYIVFVMDKKFAARNLPDAKVVASQEVDDWYAEMVESGVTPDFTRDQIQINVRQIMANV